MSSFIGVLFPLVQPRKLPSLPHSFSTGGDSYSGAFQPPESPGQGQQGWGCSTVLWMNWHRQGTLLWPRCPPGLARGSRPVTRSRT